MLLTFFINIFEQTEFSAEILVSHSAAFKVRYEVQFGEKV